MNESSLDSVVQHLHSGMRIGLGGFWFVRTPMALTDAILDSEITDLELVCFGGGLAVERLITERRVRTVYFSFHSMDVFGPAPAFRAAMESRSVEGIELTTLVMSTALRAAEENLPYLPIRGPEESAFIDGRYPLPAISCPLTGQKLRAVPALKLDAALIHGTRSDEMGNVEIVGAHGLDLRILGAATHRVVSVEERVPPFQGPERAHLTTIPRFLINQVVQAPGGAAPSSCLPYYPTDLAAIDSELQPADRRLLSETRLAPAAAKQSSRGPEPGESVSNAEMLVCSLANQLIDGGVYTVGSVTPVSMVAYQLAKRTHAPKLALIPFAGLVDVDFYPAAVAQSESEALANAYAFWGMEDLYERLYQAGRIDAEIFCPAQIDQFAHVNNSWVTRNDGLIRLPGQAGIADVATMHRNLYMYVPRHSRSRLVSEVSFRGGARHLLNDEERTAAGFQIGEVTVTTNLCIFRQDKGTGRLEVESIHPGVSLEEIHENTGFKVTCDKSTQITSLPDEELLEVLRNDVDPFGIRNLETFPSGTRRNTLANIIANETMRKG